MASPIIKTNLITTGTMSGSTETFVEVSNGCFVRKIGIDPNSWTRLRVGIRLRTTYDSTLPTAIGDTPRVALGFCSGQVAIPGDKTPQHFVGCVWNDTAIAISQSWTTVYQSTVSNISGLVIASGSWTLNTNIAVSSGQSGFTNQTQSANVWLVDVYKTGGTYGIGLFCPTSTVATTEYVTDGEFKVLMETPTPVRTRYTWDADATSNSTITESLNGYFDSICFWVEREYPAVQIVDIRVNRIA